MAYCEDPMCDDPDCAFDTDSYRYLEGDLIEMPRNFVVNPDPDLDDIEDVVNE